MNIRTALSGLRKELCMSQADLAAALGVSAVTINRWETGKNPPTRVMARAILALATSRKISKAGYEALEDALFPKPENHGMDELHDAEIGQINNLLNDSSNGVFVCASDTYELLYLNRQMGRYVGKEVQGGAGQKCYEYLQGRTAPCEGCPMATATVDEFRSREYQSPTTGRHYLTRSKNLIWAGRRAHIEYVTDITEQQKVREELERSRELLSEACRESGLWLFTYDIPADEATFGETVQQELHLPEKLPQFFARMDKHIVVYPAYVDEIHALPARLRGGEKNVELLLQVEFRSTTSHWIRLRGKVAAQDEAGHPQTAIFSCQIIDREISATPRAGLAAAHAALGRPAAPVAPVAPAVSAVPAPHAVPAKPAAPTSADAAQDLPARERRARLALELLKNMLPGGFMGCYLEPGFPFYFINDTMLTYLGYRDEADFVASIDGKVENTVLPEDWPAVQAAVNSQIAAYGEYAVDYRILKKDGSFFWVHDAGRKFTAEDGRDAILFTCVDITEIKEHERFLDGLVDGLNGELMLIAVDEKNRYTLPVYASEGVGPKQGVTQEEFMRRNTETAMQSVLPADRTRVWESILVALKNREAAPSVSFRTYGPDGRPKWINASFTRHGTHEGLPVLLALFTTSSEQYDLQRRVLDQNETGIAVVDAKTHEVYYANDAMFCLLDATAQDYTGKRCPEVLGTFFGGCEHCPMHSVITHTPMNGTIKVDDRWVKLHAEHRLWTDKEVVCVYASDVTESTALRQKLERANADMAGVLKNASCGISVLEFAPDGTSTPVYQSEALARLVGIEHSKLADWFRRDPWLGADEDERPRLRRMIADLFKNGGTEEMTYRGHTAQGALLWVQTVFHAVPSAGGGTTLYTSCTDVTEKMTRHEQMRRYKEINEAGARFSSTWLFSFDTENDTIYPNSVMQKDFGLPSVLDHYPESDASMRTILPEYKDAYRDAIRKMKAGAGHVSLEVQMRDVTNQVHWVRMDLTRLSENTILPNYVIGMARVIDREKEMQGRLEIEQQKMVSYNPNLLRYIVLNLTKNTVVQERNFRENVAPTRIGMTMAEVLHTVQMYAVQDAGWQQYYSIHDCQGLIELCNSGKTNFSIEGRRRNADGKIIWLRNVMNLMRDPATGEVYLYEYAYDINDQKLQEEILQASVQCNTDRLGRVELYSGSFVRVFAQGQENKLALQTDDYTETVTRYGNTKVLPEDREHFLQSVGLATVRRELANSDNYQFTHRVEENGTIHYKRNRYIMYDRANGLVLLTRNDVTALVLEQKKAVQERENLFVALRNTTPLMVVGNLTRNEFELVRGRHFFAKPNMLNGKIDDLIQERALTLPEEERAKFIETLCRDNLQAAASRGEKQISLEHRQRADDGSMHWVETRLLLTRSELDGELYAIVLAQDITDRKQQELALKQAMAEAKAASNAKSEFLSRMSHEIRTPMNAIMGMTAIAKENRGDYVQVGDCLDKIDLSSHFLLTLINDILEMSRIESGRAEIKREEFDFSALMTGICTVVEPLARKANLRFECVQDSKVEPAYLGDAMRLQQVLVNIITNAVKFTKAGGRVRFFTEIERVEDGKADFSFEVADTGIGMSEAFMERMFNPFTQEDSSNTSQFGGSGLGLAISKSLVEAMGGKILVDSLPGVGTTFTIKITLDRVSAAEAARLPAHPLREQEVDLSVLHGAQVLLAEDHPLNVMVARKILERKGVTITVAENGRVAVDTFAASAPGRYDAILMDIRMPVMDGWDATVAIRDMTRPDAATIPIIAMTANAMDEDRRHSREVGMNDHLAKPFEPSRLYRVLAEQIAVKRRGGEEQ